MFQLWFRSPIVFGFAAALIILVSCGKSFQSPFDGDPTKSPLPPAAQMDAAEGPFCKLQHGKYVEESLNVAEKTMKGEHCFSRGGGCILRPINEVWAALHNPEAVHWKGADIKSSAFLAPPLNVAFLFSVGYEAGPSIFSQSWTMQYFETLSAGSLTAPLKVLVQYKKTEGTGYIEFWQGALELIQLNKGVTSFSMQDEIQAAQTSIDDSVGNIRDVLQKLRTVAPVWDQFPKP